MTKNHRALLLMVISVAMLACLDGIVKIVNNLGMHPFEIAFLRNLFGVVALIPFFMNTVRVLSLGIKIFYTEDGKTSP